MGTKTNIVELLKDCPSGMELDCTCADNVAFDKIIEYEQIKCRIGGYLGTLILDKYGRLLHIGCPKCVIFPKGKTTWEGFQRPFKDGDIITCGYIYENKDYIYTGILAREVTLIRGKYFVCDYCSVGSDGFFSDGEGYCDEVKWICLATEEEKQILFDAIKANGYKWNAETKTLEELEDMEEKEETIETITIDDFKANTKEWLIDKLESMSRDNALQAINNIYDELHKPKYPKTFIEVLNFWHPDRRIEDDYQRCYKKDLIEKFQDLLYARDTYWKIAGEEMRLGKPWKPDWTKDTEKYVIYPYQYLYSIDTENYRNTILAFPTAEMRDAFYENFKDLIENVKEFL